MLNDCGAKLYSYYAGNESKVFKALKSKYNKNVLEKGLKRVKDMIRQCFMMELCTI